MFVASSVQGGERKLRRHLSLQAILGDKVMLSIDGERQLLSQGQSAVSGVRVLRITDEHVEVSVDGQQRKLLLGASDSVVIPFKERQSVSVSIPRDTLGMYSTVGSINGLTVKFLVDTGATTISLNAHHARRLGIEYRTQGKKVPVGTASGMVHGYLVKLRSVSVGEISLNNVDAVVIDGAFPQDVLLGMSFLGKVQMRREAAMLYLKKDL